MAQAGFLRYLKEAFLWHWNLLFLGAAFAFAIVAGRPDIFLPQIAALELLYLAILSSSRRFQAFVDALEKKAQESARQDISLQSVNKLLEKLSSRDRAQFKRLQSLCERLFSMAEYGKGEAIAGPSPIMDMRFENVNRLLWIYLKLLCSKSALEDFFASTDEKEIRTILAQAQGKLESLGDEREDTPSESKHRKTLSDTIHTSEARLANYQRAKENFDYIGLELERLYAKIASIVETGINRQDPAFVSSEIDVVSHSAVQTEKTMQELESITGVFAEEDQPPTLLSKGKRALEGQ